TLNPSVTEPPGTGTLDLPKRGRRTERASAREGHPPRARRPTSSGKHRRRPGGFRRQDPDLSWLWARVRVDRGRAGVLSEPRTAERTQPVPVVPCRAPRER